MKIEFGGGDLFTFGCGYCQYLHISTFRVLDIADKTEAQVVMEFITDDTYSKNPSQLSPFVYGKLNITHFKQFDKKQLFDYLYEYRNTGKWNIDERVELNNSYYRLRIDIEKSLPEYYYVINLDWFQKEDAILYPGGVADIHFYFINIFWFDRENMTITACELTYN